MNSNTGETEEHGFVSPSVSDGSTPEIVVVGDDDIADIIRRYLSEAGYDVTPVRNVEEYVGSVSTSDSGLVIRSVTRSMLDDGELHLDERLERHEVPILAISGPTLTESQVEHAEANVVGWITKPFERADLVRQVEYAIERGAETGGAGTPSGSDRSERVGAARSTSGTSGRTADSNGHTSRTTTPDVAAAVQADSERDGAADTTTDIRAEPHGTPARTDELDAALERIRELEAKQEATSADVDAVTDQLSDLSTGLTAVSERLDALDDRIDELNGRADAIETDVVENREAIRPLSEGLDTLADKQLLLADEIEETTREQAELRSIVDALTEWQDDVSSAFSALQVEE